MPSAATNSRDSRGYVMGLITGASLAVAAFCMMGQG